MWKVLIELFIMNELIKPESFLEKDRTKYDYTLLEVVKVVDRQNWVVIDSMKTFSRVN